MELLAAFIKDKRKQAQLTQAELANRAGVGIRFLRELEGGKKTLRLDKVEQILLLFGHTIGPVPAPREEADGA